MFLASGPSNIRPMRRFASQAVFSGFERYEFCATSLLLRNGIRPYATGKQRRESAKRKRPSPCAKLTHKGVIQEPWSLG